jgi:hypothetical protein
MIQRITFFLFVLFFLCVGIGRASPVQLPKTGQVKCYDMGGAEIPCADTGQDGEYQAGVQWPDPRFTITYCNNSGPCPNSAVDCDSDASNDVVIDNLTGLIWMRDGNVPNDMIRNWNDAVDYANGVTFCGYSDWQLPNVNELESLTHAGEPDTAKWLLLQGFTNVQSNFYWSSTTRADYTDSAWIVSMSSGYVYYDSKNTGISYYVWPVRGNTTPPAPVWKTGQIVSYRPGDDGDLKRGLAWPDPRFITTYCNNSGLCPDQDLDCDGDASNDVVTDTLTGLMWTRNANWLNNLYGIWQFWQDALDYANSFTICGYSDWRLPNRKELFSLIDRSEYSPALLPGHPFDNVQTRTYYSSTTPADYTVGAWIVGMWNGSVIYDHKGDHTYSVWPVRAGGPFGYSTFWTLSVAKTGDGVGTITSSPSGIDCGDDCTDSFIQGQIVTLTASAGNESAFAYWSGACTGTQSTCSLNMLSNLTVTAHFVSESTSFTKQLHRLFVIRLGNGTITSDDDKISCPTDCNEKYYEGTTVTLTAIANAGSKFEEWRPTSLGCSDDTCTVTMDSAKTVIAVFARDNKR